VVLFLGFDNEITDWIIYFSRTFLESQKYTQKLIEFLLAKTKLFNKLQGQLNERQEKVLHRMFEQGLDGFKVGLSAENYLKITKTSRPTATRDLQDLVKKGALLKVGELKATRYFLDLNI
jgi:Fic family protein